MIKDTNLSKQINKYLPLEMVELLNIAESVARHLGYPIYIVGGVVRDLLLSRENLDLDLVIEGDAFKVAEELAGIKNEKVIARSQFNTAKIKWSKWTVDIASARSEKYETWGALPSVRPGDISSDLLRRDFTINALAIYLSPQKYGELIDLCQGREDLEKRLIRVLNDGSFKDDATRIWRAVRYEQRLGFRIEPHTLGLIQSDIAYLDSISGDRIRHELELCLEEGRPEKALMRADELGLLSRISPFLRADESLSKTLVKARGVVHSYPPPEGLYLALVMMGLTQQELTKVIAYLKFNRVITKTLIDSLKLKSKLEGLNKENIPPSLIYKFLSPYSIIAILANLISSDNSLINQRIEMYLNKLRHIHPVLSGEEIIEAGVSGPQVKKTLEVLREARLDGKISTASEELELIKKMGK
jgi:tRNA nucleotidyltransferase (CCA-adding enzyme)